jgi:hypothetical protein
MLLLLLLLPPSSSPESGALVCLVLQPAGLDVSAYRMVWVVEVLGSNRQIVYILYGLHKGLISGETH